MKKKMQRHITINNQNKKSTRLVKDIYLIILTIVTEKRMYIIYNYL